MLKLKGIWVSGSKLNWVCVVSKVESRESPFWEAREKWLLEGLLAVVDYRHLIKHQYSNTRPPRCETMSCKYHDQFFVDPISWQDCIFWLIQFFDGLHFRFIQFLTGPHFLVFFSPKSLLFQFAQQDSFNILSCLWTNDLNKSASCGQCPDSEMDYWEGDSALLSLWSWWWSWWSSWWSWWWPWW